MTPTPPRIKWQLSLAGLAQRCHVNAVTLSEWARIGVMGRRFKEHRDQGWARHITREAAQRAVIYSRLTRAGLTSDAAMAMIRHHETGEEEHLTVWLDENVQVQVNRRGLP